MAHIHIPSTAVLSLRSSSYHSNVVLFPVAASSCFVISHWPLASRASHMLTGVSFLFFTLTHCPITVSPSQAVAASNPKQVQGIYSKKASTPTSPTSPTSPAGPTGGAAAWTDNKGADKGQTLLTANPEAGKDLFNMKP